jgi:hypothetical protein
MSTKWKLKRTTQCKSCPHRAAVEGVPSGYKIARATIAQHGSLASVFQQPMLVMSCHETRGAHCVGWLVKQHGPAVRLHLRQCSNVRQIVLVGEQKP